MKETKVQKVARKRLESLILERSERSRIGSPTSSTKTADRMLYDRPVNVLATKGLTNYPDNVKSGD